MGTECHFGKMEMLWARRSAPGLQTLGAWSGASLPSKGCPLNQLQEWRDGPCMACSLAAFTHH